MKQILIILFLGLGFSLYSQNSQTTRIKNFNLEKNLALQGYDPVSYFTKGKAVKGNSKIIANYSGIIYHFSSEENKKLFEANPTKYEPQYGGWCAYALGEKGTKVEINPETFKIIDGKLYLFYNAYFNNTLTSWNKNEKELKSNADKNWEKLIQK